VLGKTLPKELKYFYLSYHAFFYEIMKSRFVSKEQSVCRMRLNFWEESLKEVIKGDKVIKEPMLIIMKEAFKQTGLRKDTLFRMIDFQFFDLERNSEMKTIEELEIYAENTRSLLIYLNLNLLNIDNKDAFIAGSHIGRGIGIVDVLKKLPFMLKVHANPLPLDLITKHGCSAYNLWDRHGTVKEEFFDLILEIAAYAKKHIEIGRKYKDDLPKNTHIAFLQAVEAHEWLLELEEYNFDIFEPRLQKFHTSNISNKMMELGKKGQY
jgi:phytoene/squalene synthetase